MNITSNPLHLYNFINSNTADLRQIFGTLYYTVFAYRRQPYSLVIAVANHLKTVTTYCASTLSVLMRHWQIPLYLQMYAQCSFTQVVSLLCESSAMHFDLKTMMCMSIYLCAFVCVCLKENKRIGNGVRPLSIEWRLLCSYYFTWAVTVCFP